METTRRTFLIALPALVVVAKALPTIGVDMASGPDLQVYFSHYWTEMRHEQMERMLADLDFAQKFYMAPGPWKNHR